MRLQDQHEPVFDVFSTRRLPYSLFLLDEPPQCCTQEICSPPTLQACRLQVLSAEASGQYQSSPTVHTAKVKMRNLLQRAPTHYKTEPPYYANGYLRSFRRKPSHFLFGTRGGPARLRFHAQQIPFPRRKLPATRQSCIQPAKLGERNLYLRPQTVQNHRRIRVHARTHGFRPAHYWRRTLCVSLPWQMSVPQKICHASPSLRLQKHIEATRGRNHISAELLLRPK